MPSDEDYKTLRLAACGGSNAIRIFDSAVQSYAESVRTPNNSVIMELFQ